MSVFPWLPTLISLDLSSTGGILMEAWSLVLVKRVGFLATEEGCARPRWTYELGSPGGRPGPPAEHQNSPS